MSNDIGNYARHARYWNWGGMDRTAEYSFWHRYAERYGKSVLIPMCAWGETGAYMAERGYNVTAFDITPEMIAEGKKRFGNVQGLSLFEGDVRDFSFDTPPMDFCFGTDFGHILTIEDMKNAFSCINRHLRIGGGLVIETSVRTIDDKSNLIPTQIWYPTKQIYPDIMVWKTGETRNDAESGRCYISQVFYAEDNSGNVESFDHSFYLQGYYRDEWLDAFEECGFGVRNEYGCRNFRPWENESGVLGIFEVVKLRTV
ncbi:MAG: class I SAM-dependent methyltransferase [Defluviitaleaceae bacterium]|nr:class I SAM-dependent methyltransferase [Defluviitaleaceae bacterium]